MQVVEAENRLNRKLSQLFSKVGNKLVKALLSEGVLDKTQINSFSMYIDENQATLENIFNQEIEGSATRGGKNMVTLLKEKGLKLSFSQFDNNTKDILKTNAFEASQTTLDKVKGNVMDSLTTSYQNGEGIKKAAQNLKKEFDGMTKGGLRRIARTEINGAQNQGSYLTLKDLDVEYKMWETAKDSRVRGNNAKDKANHRKLHGQIVPIHDKFSNGLMYPGDRSGRIEDWIQCRCTLVPFIMPSDKMAPPGKSYFYERDLVDIPN